MTARVVVAGGGLAGAAVAALLARAGREVLVVEREASAVEKICGEFVSAEAQDYLRRVGIDVGALGAHPIGRLRLVRGARVVACKLPFAGLGVSRRVLDEALLRHCGQCGAEVRRGQSVSLTHAGAPLVLGVQDGTDLPADTLFLATGKHDLRGLRRRVTAPPSLIGFKLHLRLSPQQQSALAGHVEIMLLRGGYAGLQLVEHGMANLCMLIERSRVQAAGGTWEGLLDDLRRTDPHLRQRLDGAAASLHRPLSIFRVPYGFVHSPRRDDPANVFRLGDQMGVIPSFTGDGMSIALHSAVLAASCYLAGRPADEYHRRIRGDIVRQIARARALDRIGSSTVGQAMLMRVAALWPGGLRVAAKLTRVPRRARSRSSLAWQARAAE